MKSSGGGAAVEWHQDFAFYPHTNDDVLAIGIFYCKTLISVSFSASPLCYLVDKKQK
jgi:hypothetical protein